MLIIEPLRVNESVETSTQHFFNEHLMSELPQNADLDGTSTVQFYITIRENKHQIYESN